MINQLKQIYNYRELLWIWTWRGIKARYKQSFLGGAWAILQPLSLMVVFTFVFTRLVRMDTGDIPYPIFSYTAILPWTLFASSITSAVPSLVENMHLVTKVFFPREIFPLAAIGARMVDFLIALLVFFGLAVFYKITLNITWLWLPLILFIQILLTIGIALLGSALNVFYRDIHHAIGLIVQLWMYATPIIYPISFVPPHLRMIYALNPMVGITEAYRSIILLGESPPFDLLLISLIASLAVYVAGSLFFNRVSWQFADII